MAEDYLHQMSKLEISAAGAVAPDAEEACLWKKLPRELQNKVLSYLPLQTLFQVRCVHKAWRYFILRRDLTILYDATHISDPSTPATVYINSSSPNRIAWSVYDYTQNTWQKRTTLPSHSHPRLGSTRRRMLQHSPSGRTAGVSFPEAGCQSLGGMEPSHQQVEDITPLQEPNLEEYRCFRACFCGIERLKRYKILMAQ